jgi:ArsR family transcriptional regulator
MPLVWKAKTQDTAEPTDSELSGYLKALGHPVRLGLVRRLMLRGPATCGELLEGTALAQSTVSEHLRILRQSGIVAFQVDGTRRVYQVERPALGRIRALVLGIE